MFTGSIQSAQSRDIDCIEELEKACFSTPWSRESLKSMVDVPGYVFITAKDAPAGCVLGYAAMETVLDEGYICNVAVSPEARRRGIGRALMLRLMAEGRSRRLAFISLEVRIGNTAAITLYEALGFARAGLRRSYYTRPTEDALIMTLELSGDAPRV